jgi:hypothetical protein
MTKAYKTKVENLKGDVENALKAIAKIDLTVLKTKDYIDATNWLGEGDYDNLQNYLSKLLRGAL